MRIFGRKFLIFHFLFIFSLTENSSAEQIHVAVASNALMALKTISAEFEKKSGHKVLLSSGSTGKLYAQIMHGAPYDVFLAANEREPEKLERANLIVPQSRFTYVLGKLVAWSPDATLAGSKDIKSLLTSKQVKRIAIANPKTAPYGFASQQVLQNMGVWGRLRDRLVRGENVAQSYQFAMTRNAQIGFVAKSQILVDEKSQQGSYWELEQELYDPIKQQAVLLSGADNKQAARDFMQFLKSGKTRKVFTQKFGYGVEPLHIVKYSPK